MSEDKTVCRALQNRYFISFLKRYISSGISWNEIADKCIDQSNEYCLKLIKAKAWTDKTEEGGSWSEKLETFIIDRLMLNFTHITLWMKRNEENLSAVIIQREEKDISAFTTKILRLIEENILQILSMYNISYRYLTPETIKTLSDDCIYINHNRISWTKNPGSIPFKRLCVLYPIIDSPITPQSQYITDKDCINAGIMLWQYLVEDEFEFPNCVASIVNPINIADRYTYPVDPDSTEFVSPFRVQMSTG